MSEFNYTKFLTENRLTPFSKVLPMQETPQPVNNDDEDMEEASFVGAPRGGAVKNMNFKEGEEGMYTISFQVKHSEIAEAAKAQELSVEDVYQAIKEWYDQYTTTPGLFKEELEDQILNY